MLALAIAAALAGSGSVRAATPAGAYASLDQHPAAMDALQEQRLFLEVFHGERPTGLIAEFRLRDGSLAATPAELAQIGLVLPAGVSADARGLVPLDALPGLAWHYDAAAQRLHLRIPAALRPQQALGYTPPPAVMPDRARGWTLGYDSYLHRQAGQRTAAVSTAFAVFGDWGTFELEGVTHFGDAVAGGERGFRRLGSRWRHSDPQRLTTWTVGDLDSGGLGWTRPVRMAGLQWRRNFATRPDLVTTPLPQFSADATLPSSVELYVNNVRQFGSEVQDGPFVLDAVPTIGGAGVAQLVVTDALGRTTTTSVPLYVDARRLAVGLSDFSIEAGVLRRGWGADDGYGDIPAASASWRRGVRDRLTVEAHAEATRGLWLGGAGAVWSPGNRWGLVTAALARSGGDHSGWQRSLGYQWHAPAWGLDLATTRRSSGFRDLGDASVVAGGAPSSARAEDRASAWTSGAAGTLAASWIRYRDRRDQVTTVRSLSWSRQFGTRAHVAASLFASNGDGGGGLTLSLPLGRDRHATIGVQRAGDDFDTTATYRRSAPYEGGFGWGVLAGDRHGGEGRATLEYRGDRIEASAGVERLAGRDGAFAQARGSVIGLGGGVYAARALTDAFAVVDAGEAGVPVLYENRLYGHTGADGRLLVTDLRGWQRNRLAIDPDALPANFRVGEIEQTAVPVDHAGVVVRFEVERRAPAILRLLGRDGAPVPAGTRVAAGGRSLIVGFDGEAFLESAAADTVLEGRLDGGRCRWTVAAVELRADGAPARPPPLACHWSAP
ncbi:fimbria/pilus outer membrane usher protein [Arenimonas composti]|nr:fimbria/pilus outer membrane usher protein [Arenimonas composti]